MPGSHQTDLPQQWWLFNGSAAGLMAGTFVFILCYSRSVYLPHTQPLCARREITFMSNGAQGGCVRQRKKTEKPEHEGQLPGFAAAVRLINWSESETASLPPHSTRPSMQPPANISWFDLQNYKCTGLCIQTTVINRDVR